MRDPFSQPFCEPDDLGLAIPDSDHAVSVCLPRWEDVIGYEEGVAEVIETFECGYPRFVVHPFVAELFLAAQEEFAKKNEVAIVFPSLAAAWRCADYVKRRCESPCRLESYGWDGLTVLLLEEAAYDIAWKCWQHGGEIVSSRLAESALTDEPLPEEVASAGEKALATIRERIASSYEEAEAEDVFLFSSGMAAIFAVHRVLTAQNPGLPSIQIEFPYLDSFKMQEEFGDGGVIDFSNTRSGGADEVRKWLADGGEASGVFSEVPSNPLLRTADLKTVSELLSAEGIPLVVDDTVATAVNVDVFRYADVATTSLTKTFSGAGDVAAGAVVIKKSSPFYATFKENLPSEESASPLFLRDAITLEVNSRHFEERVRATNENAAELVDWLQQQDEVKEIWHPSIECRDYYDQIRKPDGGYGALISLLVDCDESGVARFYDTLPLSKGPSLGTDFSLVCPYTMLAHYNELTWAAERGAAKELIRIWVGLEDPEALEEAFSRAFRELRQNS